MLCTSLNKKYLMALKNTEDKSYKDRQEQHLTVTSV